MSRKIAFIGIRRGETLVLHENNSLSMDEDYETTTGTHMKGNRPISMRPWTKEDVDGLIYGLQQMRTMM